MGTASTHIAHRQELGASASTIMYFTIRGMCIFNLAWPQQEDQVILIDPKAAFSEE